MVINMEEIMRRSDEAFDSEDYHKLIHGRDLLMIAEELENNYEYQEQWGTFKSYLASKGRSLKQVTPKMTAYKYINDYNYSIDDVRGISVNKLNLFYRKGVPLNDDTFHDLLTSSYTDLNIKYGSQAEYQYE